MHIFQASAPIMKPSAAAGLDWGDGGRSCQWWHIHGVYMIIYIYMVYICIYRYSNPPKKMESYLISILIGIYCSIFLWFLFAIYKVISVYRVYIYTIRYVGNIYMYKYMYRYVYIYIFTDGIIWICFLFLWKKHGICQFANRWSQRRIWLMSWCIWLICPGKLT